MAGHRRWSEIKAKLSPAQRAEIDADVARESREIDVQRERAARGLDRIVFEDEGDGTESAYVEGAPVYAKGATREAAERTIQDVLDAYKKAHPITRPDRN